MSVRLLPPQQELPWDEFVSSGIPELPPPPIRAMVTSCGGLLGSWRLSGTVELDEDVALATQDDLSRAEWIPS